MSWSVCYSGCNNIDFNFPPIMNDGRNYSSWQPEAVINNNIIQKENIKTNWDYIRYLQNHGLQIMNYNSEQACYCLGLDPHYNTNDNPSTNVPYNFKNIFNTKKPGFGYCDSDLKNPYLSREQLNARLISPYINPNTK